MTHWDESESESQEENLSSQFSLFKTVSVQTSKPGDLRIPIPPEVRNNIEFYAGDDPKVRFGWYYKYGVPVISNKSLREDEYNSTQPVKILFDDSDTEKIRPPCASGEIDYISYAENNDYLHWIATEDMLSDSNASSAYLLSPEKLLMIANDTNGSISNEFLESPNYTITNTRQESASNSQISILSIFTDIFAT